MNTETIFIDPVGFAGISDDTTLTEAFIYELSDIEKLCFTCSLPECKENSNKCPMKIAKKAAKAKK